MYSHSSPSLFYSCLFNRAAHFHFFLILWYREVKGLDFLVGILRLPESSSFRGATSRKKKKSDLQNARKKKTTEPRPARALRMAHQTFISHAEDAH